MAPLPPWEQAEQTLLTCVLRDPTLLRIVRLEPEQFSREAHSLIWRAVQHIKVSGQPVTPRTVNILLGDYLKDRPEVLEKATAYVVTRHAVVIESGPEEAQEMARKVRQYAALRAGAAEWESIGQLLRANDPRAVDALKALVVKMDTGVDTDDIQTWAQTLGKMWGEIDMAQAGKNANVPTGITSLDGLRLFGPGDYALLAARTNIGKSALALRMAAHAAEHKHPTLYVSMEMADTQLARRVIAATAKVSSTKLKSGDLDETDFTLAYAATQAQQDWHLFQMDRGRRDMETVRARALRHKATTGLSLIVVDYIQKLHTSHRSADARQRIVEISGALKDLAGDLGCAVLGLSQLRRLGGDPDDARNPTLEDMKESGSLEEDADSVMLLYPNLKGVTFASWRDAEERPMTLEVAKNRDGQTGVFKMNFIKRHVLFVDA